MLKWFDRKFDFTTRENILPSIIERLEGTTVRLRHKVKSLPDSILVKKLKGTWSIKEHIGHLIDLEPLWQGRLEDIQAKRATLREADLSNRKTHEANHNQREVTSLLHQFEKIREETVNQLRALPDEQVFWQAIHPRLKVPMRTLDLFIFTAEHDDHHLASISNIIRSM